VLQKSKNYFLIKLYLLVTKLLLKKFDLYYVKLYEGLVWNVKWDAKIYIEH
jgi:hypothetical protein